MFTARYALSPYIKQIRFVFKGLITLHFLTVLNAKSERMLERSVYVITSHNSAPNSPVLSSSPPDALLSGFTQLLSSTLKVFIIYVISGFRLDVKRALRSSGMLHSVD
jgi:hypothetical protein